MDAKAIETSRLKETLALVDREKNAMDQKLNELTEHFNRLLTRGATYDDELEVQYAILSRARLSLRGLILAQITPFFSRIDFTPKDGEAETHYIGKNGVIDSDTLDSVVVDWRSPIANLYYSGQIGRANYEAPDGTVDGDLTLKRMFTIENRALTHVLDVDLTTQDQLLVDALSAVSTDRLKEVVTTIQAEQNAIIRHPPREPLIVQGVAGSGKTTIALHRIAYLLYRYADSLSPEKLMILAPNPLFLRYISEVLPDLGVENARQTTFMKLAAELLGSRAPKIAPGEPLDALLDDPALAESVRAVCREKGSLAFGEDLSAYLDSLENAAAPSENVRFGPLTLLTAEQMQAAFRKDLSPFPWRRRQEELIKTLKKRGKTAANELRATMSNLCAQKADKLRFSMPDGEERRVKLTTLYQSRDDRLAEIDARLKQFNKDVKGKFPSLDPYVVYADFLINRGASPESVAPLRSKKAAQEDLPALLLIEKRLGGIPDRKPISHIIIDEAQDFSPLSLHTLKELYGASFTLVGDMGQGVYRYRGMDDWREAQSAIPGARVLALQTSYRSTVEIIDHANEVAKRHPYPGQILANAVLRRGEKPFEATCATENDRAEQILSVIDRYKKDGMHSIAVIARDTAFAQALYKRLQPKAPELKMLDPEADDYRGGALIASATSVKGLEFDAVIVPDAERYPDDLTGSRLLYVCFTRALHKLATITLQKN